MNCYPDRDGRFDALETGAFTSTELVQQQRLQLPARRVEELLAAAAR